jgi:hypothetical protein
MPLFIHYDCCINKPNMIRRVKKSEARLMPIGILRAFLILRLYVERRGKMNPSIDRGCLLNSRYIFRGCKIRAP